MMDIQNLTPITDMLLLDSKYLVKHYNIDNVYYIECYDPNNKLVFKSTHSKDRHTQTLRKVKIIYDSNTDGFNKMMKEELKDYHN